MSAPNHPIDPSAVRVLVVEDSAPQRAMLVRLLNSDPDVCVVGWAASGPEGVQAAARLKPDVITMDLLMPTMDGLEASRLIMQKTPTPIVLVTATAAPRDQAMAAEAFRAGVLALAQKPGIDQTTPSPLELVETVKGMARLKVIRRLAPERIGRAQRNPGQVVVSAPTRSIRPDLVVIGSSTGGPQALQQLLSRLPSDYPLPILVVQHIARGFDGAMVEWLSTQCQLSIRLGQHGMRIPASGVIFAPTDRHMLVCSRTISLVDGAPVSGHRPSATQLFQSVAAEYGAAAVGIVLTGMADDGALGLSALKERGAITFAQDEATSVVFGMPGAAIELGVVDHVLSPLDIADSLIDLARKRDDD